jgi:hypothetical protein
MLGVIQFDEKDQPKFKMIFRMLKRAAQGRVLRRGQS